jgi:dihydrofolate synthase/folylpolyglutamate synthase
VLGEAMADLEAAAPRPLVLICGTLATKDTVGFLSAFRGLARQVYAVPIPGEHAGRAPQEVAEAAAKAGLPAQCAASVAQALTLIAAQTWDRPPRILIAGSLYLAGKALETNGAPPV